MPNDGYRALTEDAPTKSSAVSAPSVAGAHCSRLREIAVQIPRRRAFRRLSSRNNDRKAPTVNDENCHSSSSSPSPPPKRDGAAGRELYFDIESSPSCTPEGCLVFVDSSPEREERRQKTVIVPPEDVLLPCPLSPDVTSPFESGPKCSGSPPSSPAGCLNITASSGPICRICHEGDQTESLMSLCKCSGTMGLLHVSCLEHWLNARNMDYCELCHHRFPTAAQANCVRRFFHWALHGDSQRAVLGDLFCFALLSPVAALSCFLCAHNASKQALEGRVMEAASLVTLAGLLITAYVAWSFLTVRFHYRAFAVWQARNPMRRILAPPFGGGAGGLARRPEGQPASLREMADVVAGSVNETQRTTQLQGAGGLRLPLEPSTNASPEDPPSAPPQSVYALGPFAGFSYW
ncbi:E3 ubiquitin-protein ligase MARCHF6 [Rhipicephalus sanguineus]|uniref:RING-CH-type domain-containing protein n=1 Tax=Rhipicephalus sanguineus TaxID=34632 RepID=A0A9D4QGD9_RHISA|nr:E3 ubiquitin-protein ligase MARCHF6 [Rhipicephalus sanguineus]KAH7982347.1 hypothetical protein HPB52_004151 [Rhipicephalus sanguineus]